MLTVLWTAKAGQGCTTAAVGTALQQGSVEPVLLVDLGGDIPAACGLAEPEVGLCEWLRSGSGHTEALSRLEVPLSDRVSLLPSGRTTRWTAGAALMLCELLIQDGRCVVVDAGMVGAAGSGHTSAHPMDALRRRLVQVADCSVLVTRPCYLSLRRIVGGSMPIDSVILLRDQARSLDRGDVAHIVGVEEVHALDSNPTVARAIDAGLVLVRPPRCLLHPLRWVAA